MLIHQFLENSARQTPDACAVIHGANQFSYGHIDAKANQVANRLLGEGLEKGQRVALLLRNGIEYIYAYYGVLKAGGVAVPLNTGLNSDELATMIQDCDATLLITEAHFLKIIRKISIEKPLQGLVVVQSRELPSVSVARKQILFDEMVSGTDEPPAMAIQPDDLASIIYTSGSTGKPKGVMLSHANVVANTESIVAYLKLTARDRCMVVLPFYYVYGKSLLNTHMKVGGSVVIDNRFTFPNVVLKTMIDEQVTGFSGVPSTYSILLNKSKFASLQFPRLRYLTQAGGHMPVKVKKQLLKLFPDKQIFIMYGATEASARLAYLEPDQLPHRLNSIGKGIPNVQLAIFREDGTEAGPGEEGEIAARGPNIMAGYWNDPEETAKVLKNGWYFTGDLGIRDDEGFFYVTGRKRDMIKSGTHKISATEIEELVYTHAHVHEAAVIGVPDDLLGEAVALVVAPKANSGLTPDMIQAFLAQKLPAYKMPTQIRLMDELPKNESGKIMKRQLGKLFN